MAEEQNGMIIKSVVKAMNVIKTVAETGSEGIKLNELVNKLQENRSVVYKLVMTLVSGGFLKYDRAEKKIIIGSALLHVLTADFKVVSLKKSVNGSLRKLAEDTGYSGYLGIVENDKAFIIDAVDGKKHIRVFASPGEMRYLHTTALGKVLLAGLNDVKLKEAVNNLTLVKVTEATITSKEKLFEEIKNARKAGYAISNEENYKNVKGIAAPIIDKNGDTLAAFSISFPDFMVADSDLDDLIKIVKEAAKQASEKLHKENSIE